MGTPLYMAPEQVKDAKNVDYRADIYSLGATLFKMLSGKNAAYGKSSMEIVANVVKGKVHDIRDYDLGLPEKAITLTEKMMSLEIKKRYSSYEQILKAIQDADAAFTKHFGTKDYTNDQVKALETTDEALLQHKSVASQMNGFGLESIQAAEVELQGALDGLAERLNTNYNVLSIYLSPALPFSDTMKHLTFSPPLTTLVFLIAFISKFFIDFFICMYFN